MNIQQARKLKKVNRRSLFNRLFIIVLFIGLTTNTIYMNNQIKDLTKKLNNSKITIIEKELSVGDYASIQPPKITDIKELK